MTRVLEANSTTIIKVKITANHKGHFEFRLCPANAEKEVTQECLDQHLLTVVDDDKREAVEYPLDGGILGVIAIRVRLPDVRCERCVLQWHYRGGNNWGVCADGSGRLGCGNQETFRACADVRVVA